jgi:hypothetical protein
MARPAVGQKVWAISQRTGQTAHSTFVHSWHATGINDASRRG